MSAPEFLQALRRFLARRGMCTIYSDNAKTFKCVAKELNCTKKILKEQLIQDFSSRNAIQWRFIAERAPWWGGFYERLIRSVKSALCKTLSRKILQFGEMQTLLAEVEAMINPRPLTFVYNEDREPTPLTPASMIMGRRLTAPSSSNMVVPSRDLLQDAEQSINLLKTTWRKQNEHLAQVWQRWHKEYLTELKSAYHSKGLQASDVKVGDVVLIKDTDTPRLQWQMGVIEETFPSSDRKVRVCVLRTANRTTIRRPVQHLYKIESAEVQHSSHQPTPLAASC
ncbi:uncharacterized protein LOC135389573 [Ornithodoros turicata]|uniref:uncharacterized protein LOC135389573 n=1 Tax=Ornithodoros turicata TaxID=34597 RepID=UPI003139B82D